MATTTISKLQRQAEQAAARAEYIQTAVVSLHGDYAEVRSQFDPEETYRVGIERGVPVSCNCTDYYWRSKRDPSHICKHMRSVEIKLSATLPMMNTPEMRKLIKSTARLFKVRRSAPNAELIAQLQVATGVRVRKVRGQKALRLVLPPVVTLFVPVCLPIAA